MASLIFSALIIGIILFIWFIIDGGKNFLGTWKYKANLNEYNKFKIYYTVDGFGSTWYYAKVKVGSLFKLIPIYKKFTYYPVDYVFEIRKHVHFSGENYLWDDIGTLKTILQDRFEHCEKLKKEKYFSRPKRLK